MVEAHEEWEKLYHTFESDFERGRVVIPEGMSEPTTEMGKFELFKSTQDFKEYADKFPEYRGRLPHLHIHPDDIMHDIALHGKIHFGDIAFLFITPLIEQLEEYHEGQAIHQYVAGMEDTGMPHKAKFLADFSVKNGAPKTRKENLVEGLKTASYVPFLSSSSRTKKDLEQRVQNIIAKDLDLRKARASPHSFILHCLLSQ